MPETLASFAELVRSADRESFCSQHDHPFLVQEWLVPDAGDRGLQFATIDGGAADLETLGVLSSQTMKDLAVYRLVKTGSGTFEGLVNVGRTENNDIVLAHPSVSKFHAYFVKDPVTNVYSIGDGGSRNGTFVNDKRVPDRQRWELEARDLIGFGQQFRFRFHLPESFHELVQLAT